VNPNLSPRRTMLKSAALLLLEQYVIVGDRNESKSTAEIWRFQPKAFKTYYNMRDPKSIQDRADAEMPLDQVSKDSTLSTDLAVHIKAVKAFLDSGVTIVNIHSGQADQRRSSLSKKKKSCQTCVEQPGSSFCPVYCPVPDSVTT